MAMAAVLMRLPGRGPTSRSTFCFLHAAGLPSKGRTLTDRTAPNALCISCLIPVWLVPRCGFGQCGGGGLEPDPAVENTSDLAGGAPSRTPHLPPRIVLVRAQRERRRRAPGRQGQKLIPSWFISWPGIHGATRRVRLCDALASVGARAATAESKSPRAGDGEVVGSAPLLSFFRSAPQVSRVLAWTCSDRKARLAGCRSAEAGSGV